MEPADIYEELNEVKWILEAELESNPKVKDNLAIESAIARIEALQEKL